MDLCNKHRDDGCKCDLYHQLMPAYKREQLKIYLLPSLNISVFPLCTTYKKVERKGMQMAIGKAGRLYLRALALMVIPMLYAVFSEGNFNISYAGIVNDCKIKGNISYNSGRHIYHMPGQNNYSDTRINRPGERWFCSEAEAHAAGWRKAKN